jgi:hypothetical protein
MQISTHTLPQLGHTLQQWWNRFTLLLMKRRRVKSLTFNWSRELPEQQAEQRNHEWQQTLATLASLTLPHEEKRTTQTSIPHRPLVSARVIAGRREWREQCQQNSGSLLLNRHGSAPVHPRFTTVRLEPDTQEIPRVPEIVFMRPGLPSYDPFLVAKAPVPQAHKEEQGAETSPYLPTQRLRKMIQK